MRTTAGSAGRWVLAGTVAAIVAIALSGASEAGAADRISACFAVDGAGVAGVTTSLEARTATGWRHLGSGGATAASGCVRIPLDAAWRTQDVRVRGALLLPARAAVTTATTYLYARGGPGSYALGTGILGRTLVPVRATRSIANVARADAGSCLSDDSVALGCWLARTGAALPAVSVPGRRR